MRTVEAIDGDIRFTAEWDGILRYVFISQSIIATDAKRALSRAESVAFVQESLTRYTNEARAQHGAGNPVQMIEITRSA